MTPTRPSSWKQLSAERAYESIPDNSTDLTIDLKSSYDIILYLIEIVFDQRINFLE